MEIEKEKKIDSIFGRVLKEIKPSKAEVDVGIANINRLMGRLKKIVPSSVEIRVTGSMSRGTNLAGNTDIDIFLLFDKKMGRDKITKLGVEYGKKLARRVMQERYEVKYAEHPYLRLYLDSIGIKADIVPAFKIDNVEEMGTSVDRTPLHTEFINEHLSDEQRDHVRLLKYLLKAHNIYGAEIKTKGFSGYLCELLIFHFNSLQNLLDKAAKFKQPTVLLPEGEPKDKEKYVKKFNSKFIIVDPVDPNRNVAAVVSGESLGKFILIATQFSKKPSIELFYGKGFDATKTAQSLRKFEKDSGLDLYLIVTKVPNKSEDRIWPQLRKVADILAGVFEKMGFEIYFTVPWINKTDGFILIAAPAKNGRSILLKGPSVFFADASMNFLEKHKKANGIIMRGDTLYAIEQNKYVTLEDAIKASLKGKIVKRHKDISLSGGKLFVNNIPTSYSELAYAELRKVIII